MLRTTTAAFTRSAAAGPTRSLLRRVCFSSPSSKQRTSAAAAAAASTMLLSAQRFASGNNNANLDNIDAFCSDFLNSASVATRGAILKKQIVAKTAKLQKMEGEYNKALDTAHNTVWWIGAGIGVFLVAQWAVLANWVFVVFDWNLVEPVTYFLAFSCAWFSVFFYTITGSEWTYESINTTMAERFARRSVAKKTGNVDFMKELEMLRAELKELHAAENAVYVVPDTDQTIVL